MKSTDLSKEQRISAEITKLTRAFSKIEERRKKACRSLIGSVAFMTVTLEDLQRSMNEHGVISEYQNGENQWGTKKSPEVEVYNTMIKNHAALVKQLTDLMPEKTDEKADDGFEKFNSSRD